MAVEQAKITICKVCRNSTEINVTSNTFLNLKKSLPPEYEYSLCELSAEGGENYHASLKLTLTTEKEARTWLNSYQTSSRTTWRTRCTYPRSGRVVICRLQRTCHHNTGSKVTQSMNRRTKNTECPANLNIRIQRTKLGGSRKCRSRDLHMPHWPMSVTFAGAHNHPIDDPSILSYRDVSPSIKKKFIQLFQDGHSVKDALKLHKLDLHKEYEEEYEAIIADRHFCPDIQYCYRLYYDIFWKKAKSVSKEQIQQLLEERITKYNEQNEQNGVCICSKQIDGEDVTAIVTPLMKRAHTMITEAGECVLIDSYSSGPGHPHLFMMLTDSLAGGLPLGCFITESESSNVVAGGFKMIQELVGIGAFNKKGMNGPRLFLTNNTEVEREAISKAFPSSKQVLCIYHILQSFWQFLFSGEPKICEPDKPYLFRQMKSLALSSSESDLESIFNTLMVDPLICKYTHVESHFMDIFGRRRLWASSHLDLDVHTFSGNTKNNFCDVAMKVLKDRPYEKLKSANTYQLMDLVTSKIDRLYLTRLEDLVEGRLQKIMSCRYGYIHTLSDFDKEEISQESPLLFTMPAQKGAEGPRLHLDMNVGFCTCVKGLSGGACKHQYVLIRLFNITMWKLDTVTDAATKKWLLKLVEGDTIGELEDLFKRLKDALEREPVMFKKPLNSFICQWAHCETDGDLFETLKVLSKAKSMTPLMQKKDGDSHGREDGKSTDGKSGMAKALAQTNKDIVNMFKKVKRKKNNDSQGNGNGMKRAKVGGGVDHMPPEAQHTQTQTQIQNSQGTAKLNPENVIRECQSAALGSHPMAPSVGNIPIAPGGHDYLGDLANAAEQAQRIVKTNGTLPAP